MSSRFIFFCIFFLAVYSSINANTNDEKSEEERCGRRGFATLKKSCKAITNKYLCYSLFVSKWPKCCNCTIPELQANCCPNEFVYHLEYDDSEEDHSKLQESLMIYTLDKKVEAYRETTN
ncbi:unnamed protein product [Caenorhabditis bovis]|uniref:Uncharacterized protein n=1 Tax=Caenorhabditis bovis TaxID=2654633 RepID=A0A8S1FF26_9PELO|nr:unnamed protein product [Caenorhabditis bovis]